MLAFPEMLRSAALKANMSIPDVAVEADELDAIRNEYPHFWVFCQLQLCRPIEWGEPWENAKVIAGIPEDKLKIMTMEDFIKAGVRMKY